MVRKILIPFFICFLFIKCSNSQQQPQAKVVERDYSIDYKTSFSQMNLDSLKLENFINEHKLDDEAARRMRDFYNSRNYFFAWFTKDGLADQTQAFWNLHNNYLEATKDSSIYDKQLHSNMRNLLTGDENTLSADEMIQLELELTHHFFRYAQYAYEGSIDPSELKWYIPRRKVDPVKMLDSLVATGGESPNVWEPINPAYRKLKKHLLHYYDIKKNGGWPQVNLDGKVLRKGDSAAAVAQVQQRLIATGDFQQPDSSTLIFTSQLEMAVKSAQRRFGLTVDGVVGPQTAGAFNVPVEERIKQMLVNMERMKWMPKQDEGTRLVANIPDFKLHVYNDKNEVFNMKIVVGKQGHNTVVFSDQLKYIVFSPYWNVPQSIVRKEILPEMRKDPNYLARKNMEQTGTRNGYPVIRQLPGGDNSLGRVKFIFPNSYAIYFHDTPAKQLFDQTDRAFSHGCIRLEQPTRLAEYLLRNNETWTSSKIIDAMYSGDEKWVELKEKIPVYITYFTSWVDDTGAVQFRDDIYGHDASMKERMFDESGV